MKTNFVSALLFMIFILTACQSAATPASISVTGTVNNEFTLAPGQSGAVTGTDLIITFDSVIGDDRCPIEVECVMSGPVSVSLSIQQGNQAPTDFALQTFTDQDGRSPNVQFEGVTNRAEMGEYLIQIVSVTPYPKNPSIEIEPSDYRVTLLVSKK